MMRPPLTPVVMLEQLVRLNDTWPRWDANDEQFVRMSRSYHEALADLDAEAVAGGVGIWLKTSTSNRWPSPAQVRETAMRWVTANRDLRVLSRKSTDEAACAVCGAVPRWAELQVTDYRTGNQGVIQRMIRSCDKERHPIGSLYIPLPHNFMRWAPPPETSPHAEAGTHASVLPPPQGTHQEPAGFQGMDLRAHRRGDADFPPAGPRHLSGVPALADPREEGREEEVDLPEAYDDGPD